VTNQTLMMGQLMHTTCKMVKKNFPFYNTIFVCHNELKVLLYFEHSRKHGLGKTSWTCLASRMVLKLIVQQSLFTMYCWICNQNKNIGWKLPDESNGAVQAETTGEPTLCQTGKRELYTTAQGLPQLSVNKLYYLLEQV